MKMKYDLTTIGKAEVQRLNETVRDKEIAVSNAKSNSFWNGFGVGAFVVAFIVAVVSLFAVTKDYEQYKQKHTEQNTAWSKALGDLQAEQQKAATQRMYDRESRMGYYTDIYKSLSEVREQLKQKADLPKVSNGCDRKPD